MTLHPSADRLADYWAGLLDATEGDELEPHLFNCSACAGESERLAALAAALHHATPPVLTAARFEALAGEGRIAHVNSMVPGAVATVHYPREGKVLVHRLGGVDLARTERVDLDVLDLQGNLLFHLDDVPFDASRGEVLITCQRHYADLYPHEGQFRLETVAGEHRQEAGRYTVLHRLHG